jgi:hypothetical protein
LLTEGNNKLQRYKERRRQKGRNTRMRQGRRKQNDRGRTKEYNGEIKSKKRKIQRQESRK